MAKPPVLWWSYLPKILGGAPDTINHMDFKKSEDKTIK